MCLCYEVKNTRALASGLLQTLLRTRGVGAARVQTPASSLNSSVARGICHSPQTLASSVEQSACEGELEF